MKMLFRYNFVKTKRGNPLFRGDKYVTLFTSCNKGVTRKMTEYSNESSAIARALNKKYSREQSSVKSSAKPDRYVQVGTKSYKLKAVICFALCMVMAFGIVGFAISQVAAANRAEQLIEVSANVTATAEAQFSASLTTSTQSIAAQINRIPLLSADTIYTMDITVPTGITAEDLEAVTTLGLVGLGDDFVMAEQTYGVNCVFIMAIATLESGSGLYNGAGNNMFGYGNYAFDSKEEGIMFVAKGLSNNYLAEDGSLFTGTKDIPGVWAHYATSETWGPRIASIMASYYSQMHYNNLARLGL